MSLTGFKNQLLHTISTVFGVLLVTLINDVDSGAIRKDGCVESQLPPINKDMKLVRNKSFFNSPWCIIAIFIIIVIGYIIVYYWILFYPILCKKERKSDDVQMSAELVQVTTLDTVQQSKI